jgi:hypothetical protein
VEKKNPNGEKGLLNKSQDLTDVSSASQKEYIIVRNSMDVIDGLGGELRATDKRN